MSILKPQDYEELPKEQLASEIKPQDQLVTSSEGLVSDVVFPEHQNSEGVQHAASSETQSETLMRRRNGDGNGNGGKKPTKFYSKFVITRGACYFNNVRHT